jgi:hypothetical protein
MSECPWSPPNPSYDPEFLIETWIAQSDAHEKAHAIERYARYVPELGWRAILAVLTLPDAAQHLSALSDALEMLVSRYGDRFIERIEHEARVSSAFKACLAQIHPSPTFPLPEHLWARLSAASGTSVGPMKRHMADLYAELPDLSEVETWDPHPLDPGDAPTMSDAEVLDLAQAYVVYHQGFWAWEELNRILEEDGPDAAWPLILQLVEKGSDNAVGAVGAGILEDLLDKHGTRVIDRVEAQAACDQRFRFCLSHVWPANMPPDLWQRVVAARGDEPERG